MFDSSSPSPRPSHLRWLYRQIKPGTSLAGWVAGPLVGVHVHWADGSKPCRLKLTAGRLKCPLCEARSKLRWIGYLPLWSERGQRLVVCVSETVGPAAAAYPIRTAVELRRTQGARDPLVIREVTGPDLGHLARMPTAVQTAAAQDIRPWLLHLWQDPELASLFAQ